ncbi:MAG TPA: DUF3237 domain-containing protein [Candidatus Dormibacteraeota bacterium]
MQTVTESSLSVELVPLAKLIAKLAPPMMLEGTPSGTRMIVEVSDLRLEGERIRARQKGVVSGDWVTISPDGKLATLDVRVTVETDDGALIFIHAQGRGDLSQGPGAAPIYSAPLFDTGDPRYAWLTKIQAISKGKVPPDMSWIEYEVYEAR